MKINKKRVHSSMWVPIPAVFLLIILMGVLESIISGPTLDIIELITLATGGMLIGAIVWLPSALICLFVEAVAINDKTTKLHVQLLLFFEALIPLLIFNGLMNGRGNGLELLISSFVIFMLAQLARWFYLKRKGKLFEKEHETYAQISHKI